MYEWHGNIVEYTVLILYLEVPLQSFLLNGIASPLDLVKYLFLTVCSVSAEDSV